MKMVNRTFRGKDAGLLVGYAPLAENLQRALDEYTEADRSERPVGRDLSEVIDLVQQLLGLIREAVVGFDWRSRILPSNRKSWFEAAMGMTNYLRSATTPGNQVPEGEERLADRYRRLSGRLTRAWALSSGTDALAPLRNEVLFYEEVRVYMAKFDAEERRASGQPVPEEIQRLLAAVIADSTETGDVVDIYEAAGIPKPELSELNPEFAARAQQATNPQLAIEALRKAILEEVGRVTRSNLVRERVFSERVTALMNRYTNSQLTSAEVIAELVALAKEVSVESRRGAKFHPSNLRRAMRTRDSDSGSARDGRFGCAGWPASGVIAVGQPPVPNRERCRIRPTSSNTDCEAVLRQIGHWTTARALPAQTRRATSRVRAGRVPRTDPRPERFRGCQAAAPRRHELAVNACTARRLDRARARVGARPETRSGRQMSPRDYRRSPKAAAPRADHRWAVPQCRRRPPGPGRRPGSRSSQM
jgi:hypothetical protein